MFDDHHFVWKNQKSNNFPINESAHNLSEKYYQEKYDFLEKKAKRKILEAIGGRSSR